MHINNQRLAIDQLTADKRAWQKIGILSTITACILAVMLVVVGKGSEKTIIVPPVVSKTFWVDGDKVAPEYIEQMALYFAQLALNANPANVDYQYNLLLQHVTPRAHGALKAELSVSAERIKRDNASQAFYPSEVTVLRNTARLKGRMVKMVGKQITSSDFATYEITFNYEGGRLYVASFKSVTDEESKG